ncbi:MAG TPA: SufS family cysteine desulfurase [Acidimicrobiales bacterium]|nr:SufS family cysteine desulfurase [Acidimicrobiales bacterium]
MALEVDRIKKDFPILERQVHGKRLVYLDSASSAQKPASVIQAMDEYYETCHANVHRGVYTIAEEATARFEQARSDLARFMGAPSASEIVFTKNITEAINLVAYSWGRSQLQAGDVVVLTEMEHHANIVPWLALKQERGIELRYIPVTDDGFLDFDRLDEALDGAKLFCVTSVSNVLGTINPIRRLADAAHAAGALILVDGAQHAPHMPLDVTALDCDFFGVTGHKMLGPTGIGALWARADLLDAMPPFLCGGEMIRDVRLDGFTTNDVPWKFEAGTPPIAEAVGLSAAISYLENLGMDEVRAHEHSLTAYALDALRSTHPEIILHGPPSADDRGGVISFQYRDVHPHDLSQVLDEAGVCVRAGHHCAKPLMRRLGVGATARASFSVYNDEADVDALVAALSDADALFAL